MLAFVFMPHETKIHAPFTLTEVDSLNGYQAAGVAHEFTCGNDSRHTVLRAAEDGWHCDDCGYTQDWAFAFMADFSWREPGPWSLIVFTAVR